MAINYKIIGQNIKKFRKKQGYSQECFAEKIGISSSYMSYIENGCKGMSLSTLISIANELNVSADELLTDNINNTIRVYNHELVTILSDCTEYEHRILLELIFNTKDSLRRNTFYFTPKNK